MLGIGSLLPLPSCFLCFPLSLVFLVCLSPLSVLVSPLLQGVADHSPSPVRPCLLCLHCTPAINQELTCLLTIQTPVQLPVFVKSSVSHSGNHSDSEEPLWMLLLPLFLPFCQLFLCVWMKTLTSLPVRSLPLYFCRVLFGDIFTWNIPFSFCYPLLFCLWVWLVA